MSFMTHKGKVNASVFCSFLKRLLHKAKKGVFLIIDDHPVHRLGKVKKFVESTKGKLRLFYLPPYSPELNPDELVWNTVKAKVGRSQIKGPDDFHRKTRKELIALQWNPDKVRSFFSETNVECAA